MAEKKKTNATEKDRKFVKDGIIYTTLTPDNPLYINNPNELQLATYLSCSNKNTFSMRNDGNAFSFTDYTISELNTVNKAGEVIETGYYVVAYDFSSHTCYYSMSKGLANEFLRLRDNNIIPSFGFCKWVVKATEKNFTTEDNKVQRTFNLDVLGIETLDQFNRPEIAEDTPNVKAVEAASKIMNKAIAAASEVIDND